MNTLHEVTLDEKIMSEIQRLKYELDGYKNILVSTLSKQFKYNIEIYERFMSDYQLCNAEYNLLLDEIRLMFGTEFKDRGDVYIHFEFSTNRIKFIASDNACERGERH